MNRFTRSLDLPVSAEAAFAWHERPGVLARLTPAWEPVSVVHHPGHLRDGADVRLRVRTGPFSQELVFRHEGYDPGKCFCDRQVQGPFRSWLHRHRFEALGPDRCRLVDDIEYALPLGALGRAVAGRWISSKLDRLFRYRHAVTRNELSMTQSTPMKILITGGTGVVGGELVQSLQTRLHQVFVLTRSPREENEIGWDPNAGRLDASALEGFDAVLHFAGESINQRWTASAKRAIRKSRVVGTRLLAERLAGLSRPPKLLLSASGINVYGDRRQETLTEDSEPGTGFLAEVCRDWEAATGPARDAGIRVVHLRLGAVLTPKGGALAKLLPIFKAGLGGKVGSGNQRFSYVSLEELPPMIDFILGNPAVEGPVNAVAPQAVTNDAFTRELALALGRPAFLPVPAFGIKVAFGEMGKATVLGDLDVSPAVLKRHGYDFRFETLRAALSDLLGTP